MKDVESSRLLVFVDRETADTRVLSELKAMTARGFVALKGLIDQELAVLDIEMFTNDWFDGGAMRVLALLAGWETRSVKFTLREVLLGVDADAAIDQTAPKLELSVLRNLIGVKEQENPGQVTS